MSRRSVLFPFTVAIFLAACGSSPAAPKDPSHPSAAAPAAEHVDGSKAKKLVAGGARLVDVRGADEFAAKHIEGAENAPVETIEDRDVGAKDAPVVVYCTSGNRSARAAATLRSKGYTHVYDLGAMSNWDK